MAGATSDSDQGVSIAELGGLALARMTEAEVVGHLTDAVAQRRGTWVITPNLDHLRRCSQEAELMHLVRQADLLVADGMPLIWASRIMGRPLPERVAGSALVWSLTEALAREQRSMFLLGGDPGVAEGAAQQLKERYPGVNVVGTLCPPVGFEADPHEWDKIVSAMADSAPDVVFVALNFPKQEQVIERLRGSLPNALFVGVGISLSYVTGAVPRAPERIRRLGFEWAWRLVHEPRKLFRRYIVHGMPFAARLLARAAAARVTPRLVARR